MEEIKCAIYTRKSTDEGLDKEFNTLEAQREAGENYVKSQRHQGWVLVDEHYDDGGVLHCVRESGVVFQNIRSLNISGWFLDSFYRVKK